MNNWAEKDDVLSFVSSWYRQLIHTDTGSLCYCRCSLLDIYNLNVNEKADLHICYGDVLPMHVHASQ